MHIAKIALLLFFSLFIASCASLSKEECLGGDWFNIGYSDGQSGLRISQLSEHREACAEYHVVPDTQAYKQGREEGLLRYCTPENALQEGLSGNPYRGVCSIGVEASFLKQHRIGMAIYDLQQEINQHKSRIATLNYDLDNDKRKAKLGHKKVKAYERELIELRIKVEEKQKRLYYMKGQADVSM